MPGDEKPVPLGVIQQGHGYPYALGVIPSCRDFDPERNIGEQRQQKNRIGFCFTDFGDEIRGKIGFAEWQGPPQGIPLTGGIRTFWGKLRRGRG